MRSSALCTLPLAALLAACGAPGPAPAGDEAPAAPAAVHPLAAEILAAELTPSELERALAHSPLPAPPPSPTNAFADDPRAAHLGRFVFFDPRFSRDGDVSCATCHDPRKGWADDRPFGVGIERVDRHTQTLWNVAQNRWFFWDGRSDSLWSQALTPLEHEREHGGSRLQYAHLVHDDAELHAAYEALFGPLPDLADEERFPPEGRPVAGEPSHPHQVAWDGMAAEDRRAVTEVFVNLGKALEAFERRIVSGPTAFDDFASGVRSGDPTRLRSLSASARRGLRLFLGKANCHLCHQGPAFTDLEFHNTRVPPRRDGDPYDPGRYEGVRTVQESPFRGTGPWSDAADDAAREKLDYLVQSGHTWGEFKTPSLRNVALTAPYMHQGQLETLEEVVRHYSTLEDATPVHQHAETILVPLDLTEPEIGDLVEFLRSLTNESMDPSLTGPPPSPLP